MKEFKVKVVVEGACRGRPVVIDRRISFFGEVDPRKGAVYIDGEEISIKGKPLIIRGTRGSTVGSYIIYSLKEYGVAPSCIITGHVEPILIVGCVIANIPLFVVEKYRDFIHYIGRQEKFIEVCLDKEVVVVYG